MGVPLGAMEGGAPAHILRLNIHFLGNVPDVVAHQLFPPFPAVEAVFLGVFLSHGENRPIEGVLPGRFPDDPLCFVQIVPHPHGAVSGKLPPEAETTATVVYRAGPGSDVLQVAYIEAGGAGVRPWLERLLKKHRGAHSSVPIRPRPRAMKSSRGRSLVSFKYSTPSFRAWAATASYASC